MECTDTTLLRVLLVDDEPLARARLRALVRACASPAAAVTGEAGHAARAIELAQRQRFDVAMLDVPMPGADGLALARALQALPEPPQVVFVSAHPGHAAQAFEVDAADYLTKPVRPQRLQQALRKAQRLCGPRAPQETVMAHSRGGVLRLPLSQVVYFRADHKYVTARTTGGSHLLDVSLATLQARHPSLYLRVHRNALVARWALRALEPAGSGAGPGQAGRWMLRLDGVPEPIPVSRRLLRAVREALAA